jgi:hypothetical protein
MLDDAGQHVGEPRLLIAAGSPAKEIRAKRSKVSATAVFSRCVLSNFRRVRNQ